jgi:hypothetical protein
MSNPLRILNETRIDIERACSLLGTAEVPVSNRSVRRAMKSGRLEYLRIHGRLITSVEAVERFVARTNGIDRDAAEASPARSKRREKDLAGVDRYLDSERI